MVRILSQYLAYNLVFPLLVVDIKGGHIGISLTEIVNHSCLIFYISSTIRLHLHVSLSVSLSFLSYLSLFSALCISLSYV